MLFGGIGIDKMSDKSMTDRYLFRGFHPCKEGVERVFINGKQIKGKWIYGSYLHLNIGKDYICDGTVWIGTLQPCKFEVIPETIGQYTELTDKNSTKIFEGDILEFNDCVDCSSYEYADAYDTVNRAIVCFEDGVFTLTKYLTEDADTEMRESSYRYRDDFVYAIEHDTVIIGNIHSSPNILEM